MGLSIYMLPPPPLPLCGSLRFIHFHKMGPKMFWLQARYPILIFGSQPGNPPKKRERQHFFISDHKLQIHYNWGRRGRKVEKEELEEGIEGRGGWRGHRRKMRTGTGMMGCGGGAGGGDPSNKAPRSLAFPPPPPRLGSALTAPGFWVSSELPARD